MRILAGYSLFILICVFCYLVKDWIASTTKNKRNGDIAGMIMLAPIIVFFILLLTGVTL